MTAPSNRAVIRKRLAWAAAVVAVCAHAACAGRGDSPEGSSAEPTLSGETIAARQHYFGTENVDPATGAVRDDRVIFSWTGVSSFAAALNGYVVLLDPWIARGTPASGRIGCSPVTLRSAARGGDAHGADRQWAAETQRRHRHRHAGGARDSRLETGPQAGIPGLAPSGIPQVPVQKGLDSRRSMGEQARSQKKGAGEPRARVNARGPRPGNRACHLSTPGSSVPANPTRRLTQASPDWHASGTPGRAGTTTPASACAQSA